MSTYCLEQAEQLHADLAALKAIEVKDADSVCAYIKGYWEFIINHKMFGSIWDIYADEIEVRRENGFSLVGIQAVENNYMNLCAAFPDLHMDVAAIFAAPAGEDAWLVWMRYYFTGTNNSVSIYGPATGLKLERDKALNISSFTVRKIEGEWLITNEYTGHCCDYIRAICTGDESFTSLKL